MIFYALNKLYIKKNYHNFQPSYIPKNSLKKGDSQFLR